MSIAPAALKTQVYSIARRDRNQPFSLDEALERAEDPRARLMINAKSHRAALQVPAPSITLDDGSVERRVRLLRPMETIAIGLEALAETQWEETDRAAFAAAWRAEVQAVPEFTTSTFHVVTGLLLPIWKRIPEESMRVYRLQTDDGERIIGRLLSPAALSVLYRNLGQTDAPSLSAGDAWTAVRSGGATLELADGLQLRIRRGRTIAGDRGGRTIASDRRDNVDRIELTGFTDGMVDRLKAMGLMSEIIAWKLRMFVPVGENGPAILASLMKVHPLIGIISAIACDRLTPAIACDRPAAI